METQQQPTPVRIDDWLALGFIYGVEEEITTEAPAEILLESPPSTIPDEDSTPHQLPSEPLPPSQEVGHAAISPSPVVEISADEEDDHNRPQLRNRGRRPGDRECQDTMDYAISATPLRKRKREDVVAVGFRSKLVRR